MPCRLAQAAHLCPLARLVHAGTALEPGHPAQRTGHATLGGGLAALVFLEALRADAVGVRGQFTPDGLALDNQPGTIGQCARQPWGTTVAAAVRRGSTSATCRGPQFPVSHRSSNPPSNSPTIRAVRSTPATTFFWCSVIGTPPLREKYARRRRGRRAP